MRGCPSLSLLWSQILRVALFAVVITATQWANADLHAANLARAVRRAAKVADDVPVRNIEEVANHVATSRAGRRVLEKLNPGKTFAKEAEELAALRHAWKGLLEASDSSLIRELEKLPIDKQRAALVLVRGGQKLSAAVPDVAKRGRILREGGAETIATLGRFDDLAEDAIRFDLALQAGKLPSPPGMPALTMNDFGKFFHALDQRGHTFWDKYVRPHWKLWLGTTALAAVMLAPDEYLDELGELTEAGFKKLGKFAGTELSSALKGAISGAGEAAQEVVEETGKSIFYTFFTSFSGVLSAILLVLVAMVLIAPTRRWLLAMIGKAFHRKTGASSSG